MLFQSIFHGGLARRACAVVALFLLIAVTASPEAPFAHGQTVPAYPRNLTVGSTGGDVTFLQEFLITKGFLAIVAPTGYFGPLTRAAVVAWQASVGLPSTGFFGPLSRAAIGTGTMPVAIGTGTGTGTGISTGGTGTTPPSLVSLNYSLGLSVGGALLYVDTATLNADLNDIASLGVGWLRFDVDWADVQPSESGGYNWTAIDRFVAAAAARRIKLLPILGYTPSWARSPSCTIATDHCAPAAPAAFAAFAAAAANRYRAQGIEDWEIWNEPNSAQFWSPAANPATYETFLRAAYVAIKGDDPTATVITGGLAPELTAGGNVAPVDFLSDVYADGGGAYFNAVAVHPYSYSALPSSFYTWNAWSQIASTVPSIRSIMAAHGDAAKQVWITEFGAPTGGPGSIADVNDYQAVLGANHVTEALQNLILSDAIAAHRSFGAWAGPMFWYSYKDLGTSPATAENFFGLVRADGTDKPAYATLKALLAQ